MLRYFQIHLKYVYVCKNEANNVDAISNVDATSNNTTCTIFEKKPNLAVFHVLILKRKTSDVVKIFSNSLKKRLRL